MGMNPNIPLKTNEIGSNLNDFVQTEVGTMKELLITITLHEYRDLIRENAELQAGSIEIQGRFIAEVHQKEEWIRRYTDLAEKVGEKAKGGAHEIPPEACCCDKTADGDNWVKCRG